MSHVLAISVRFYDGRYHGRPEWPPSPARLFQALLSGAARGKVLRPEDQAALEWLERLPDPPIIAAPLTRAGNGFGNFVPNNDLDAVGGDVRRVSEIKAAKSWKPLLFDERVPLIYAWTLDYSDGAQAAAIEGLAAKLYQLGRGVDMAWAWSEILDKEIDVEALLAKYGRAIYRPTKAQIGRPLQCPQRGTAAKLLELFNEKGITAIRVQAPTKKDPLKVKLDGQLIKSGMRAGELSSNLGDGRGQAAA